MDQENRWRTHHRRWSRRHARRYTTAGGRQHGEMGPRSRRGRVQPGESWISPPFKSDANHASIRRTLSSQALSGISSICSFLSSANEVSSGMTTQCTRERTARICIRDLVSLVQLQTIRLRSIGGMRMLMRPILQFPRTSC